MKRFTSHTQRCGELAETLACRYLAAKGFTILERNYTKRCGEIDIIAQKGKTVHFIEVKSVSRENSSLKPEDHMNVNKLERLSRIVSSYILEHDVDLWQIDLVCLIVDRRLRRALIWKLENIILSED